jgi:plasmid stability protein
MRRRELLAGAVAGAFLSVCESRFDTMAAQPTPEEIARRKREFREKAMAAFPFELLEAAGDRALATWEQLRDGGHGFPVVIGGDDSLDLLIGPFGPNYPNQRTAAEILAAASTIRHPGDIAAHMADGEAKAREYLRQLLKSRPDAPLPKMIVTDSNGTRELTREETWAAMLREKTPPPAGEWPAEAEPLPELSVARTYRGVLPKVYIALVPTDDWTTVPAHLRYGGWNACPLPEYHVAALRSWRDRYGAELIGLSFDRMDLRVTRRPQSRAEALELAREHYIYCNDIVDQGLGTLSALAACLMANDLWEFWWD